MGDEQFEVLNFFVQVGDFKFALEEVALEFWGREPVFGSM
jgi:hypothetical protein